jgi:hypothetical protein
MTRSLLSLTLAATLVACTSNPPPTDAGTTPPVDTGPADAGVDAGPVDADGPWHPDQYCPGGPNCADMGDDVLHVGAASAEITPVVRWCTGSEPDTTTCTETIDVDVNHNGIYEPADGDTFHDWNGDGAFQGVWMAGFDNARGATSVRDPQYARALALRYNETTIVLVSLDLIGYFDSEMDLIRDELATDPMAADVDWVFFSSTHVHQARDSIGLWGVTELDTGVDPAYMARVRTQAHAAVVQAVAALAPANVEYTRFSLRDTSRGVLPYISDVRDPVVYDDEVKLMRFVAAGTATGPGTGTTIATLVNFGGHPESFWDDNTGLSSDFVHYVRDALENGVVGPDGMMEPGLGGLAIFYQGALGGQVGPDRLRCNPATDTESSTCAWDGTSLGIHGDKVAFVSAIGGHIGWYALRAVRGMAPATSAPVLDMTARVAFRRRRFYVTIENTRYHIGLLSHVFTRPTFLWNDRRPISPTNMPAVLTEVAVVDVGRSTFVMVPGELDPILFLGGLEMPYDYTPPGVPINDPGNPNPPDLSMRPHAPFIRDLARMARSDAEYIYLFGLSEDYLGYFVPPFNYELDPTSPYLNEPPGDHYEETNSVGEHGWPTISAELETLIAWHP